MSQWNLAPVLLRECGDGEALPAEYPLAVPAISCNKLPDPLVYADENSNSRQTTPANSRGPEEREVYATVTVVNGQVTYNGKVVLPLLPDVSGSPATEELQLNPPPDVSGTPFTVFFEG